MKNKITLLLCVVLFCSHDMYLKMDTYFIAPNTNATIYLYNGTFDKSENIIDRDRMIDASLLGNGNRQRLSENQWTEKDSITVLNFTSGDTGTYVAGISTKARNIEMEAQAFNDYLAHDGVKDMLASRRENGTLDKAAVEKYSKHVKAIFQVGDTKTNEWSTALGYPIEFVPLSNPYDAHTGDTIQIQLLRDGKPLANQLVYADYQPSANGHNHEDTSETHTHGSQTHSHEDEPHSHAQEEHQESHTHQGSTHSHDDGKSEHSLDDKNEPHTHDDETESHTHTTGQELRTDENGTIAVDLLDDGIWYVRTIHLVNSAEEGLTHESNWATLTFEVTHAHNQEHTAAHSHDEEEGIPSYVFWIGSLVILGGLFFFFSRKK